MLRAASVPAALVGMIALAGVALDRVYAGTLLTGVVAGAAVGAALVGVAARRLPSWLVAPLSVAAMLGYTALALRLAARRAELTGGLGQIAVDAAGNGVARLLTAMIPVEPTPDTVLVPLVAAWLAGLAGVEVAVRAGRVLLGCLPPALLYVGAVYVVGPNAEPASWPTLAFAGLAAVALVASAPGAVGESTSRLAPQARAAARAARVATTAVGLAVVAALVAVLAPVVAGQVDDRPVDPRRYVEPPRVESLDENPLIRISGWALRPEQKLFDLTADRGGADGGGEVRLRLGVLSDYDGVTWRVGATYRNAGRVLPAVEPAPGSRVDTVRQEVTVAGLSGRLLPAVATPRAVDGARVAYDPASGTLIRPEGLTPGLRYTVVSARERPDVNLLATADVPAGPEVARVLRVADGAPEPMRRLATQLAEENGAPYARATAIEQFLAEHYRAVPDAPSGHAYPNLGFFLFGPRDAGGQRGTSEQFAAAFAVLGRLTGLPTRVVVGFSATGSGPVRAADAFAWPEVLFDGLGWVAFDPLPRPDDEPRPVEEDFRPAPEDPPPSEAPEPAVTPPGTPPAVAGPPRRDPAGVSTVALVGAGAGGLLLVVAAALLTLAGLRRRLTRRRLDRGDPADRVAGAWREVTDAVRLAGRPVGDDLAATEVAAHAHRVLADARAGARAGRQASTRDLSPDADGPGVAELAALVNQVAFAPGGVTGTQADRAAEIARAHAAALRAVQPRWRRWCWPVRPGPLRWRP
ncbi:transglutaminaseTgpA domain-containing protein [Micromonospora sp. WMMD882]|uniref:transglutaminase domain-containing protein n=1 Tax=Micromonospora sp. WMMD882 TaxID=3015151 RepID=UPI00248C2365|nr:transglutaminase domain-containing protein [Micromonospora sp. WMMD882]WBB82269.1 transglutaminaseTgpA domain-containing protein [Micromonospora sp. WMMD882]